MTVWSLILLASIIALVQARVARVSMTNHDLVWFSGNAACPAQEREVYTRYLERHRRHRLVGGLVGVVFAISVGIRWYGTVTVGIGYVSPLADVLFCGLAGVIIGSLSAESFRLSEPTSPTIAALLTVREGYSLPAFGLLSRGIVAAAAIAALAVAVTGNGISPLLIALGGAVTLLVAERTQTAIRTRRRPMLSDRAQSADLRMRSFASAAVARLELSMAVLAAGWTLATLPESPIKVVEVALGAAVLAGLVGTIMLLRKAAPHPPRDWTSQRKA